MKFFVSILLFFISATTALDNKILDGTIRHLVFDSSSNSHVNVNFNNYYKLDKKHNVNVSYKFPYIWEILVNTNDDVFVIGNFDGNDDGTGAYTGGLWRLKSYSNDLELLFKFPILLSSVNNFIDKDDNIFLNTNYGVVIFRSRKSKTVPLAVANLGGYYYENYAEDNDGNVYFSSKITSPNSIAIITKSAKRKLIPDAILYVVSEKSYITDLTSWNGDVIFVDKSKVKRLRWDLFEPMKNELVMSQYNTIYTLLNGHSNRLFIISKEENEENLENCQAHFLTLDDELITTENVLNCYDFLNLRRNPFSFKKDGTGYFISSDSNGNYVLSLSRNGTKFDYSYRFEEYIASVATDDYDNVWIMTDNVNRGALFAVPRGSNNLTLIFESDLAATWRNFIRFKMETNELFVAGEDGAYVFKNVLNNW